MATARKLRKLWFDFYLELARWAVSDLASAADISAQTVANWYAGGKPSPKIVNRAVTAINNQYLTLGIAVIITSADVLEIEPIPDPRLREMYALRERGSTNVEIAELHQLSKERVRQLLGKWTAAKKIVCPRCGNTFKPNRIDQNYCSNYCSPLQTGLLSYADRAAHRLAQRIEPPTEKGCWEWSGCINPTTAYGRASWNQKSRQVHRIVWMLVYGEIPRGKSVLHKCDNPPCCNPYHLYLGTPADNAHDRKTRNRGNRHHSFTKQEVELIRATFTSNSDITAMAIQYNVHPTTIYKIIKLKSHTNRPRIYANAKLSATQVRRIRDIHSYGHHSCASLGTMYDVSGSCIECIIRRKTWSHL